MSQLTTFMCFSLHLYWTTPPPPHTATHTLILFPSQPLPPPPPPPPPQKSRKLKEYIYIYYLLTKLIALYILGMRMKRACIQPHGAKNKNQVKLAWLKWPTQVLIQGQWWSIFITHLENRDTILQRHSGHLTILIFFFFFSFPLLVWWLFPGYSTDIKLVDNYDEAIRDTEGNSTSGISHMIQDNSN